MNTKLRRSLLALTICELMGTSRESVVGVTYKDNFDFEERYANSHECDPMYWHPLHLPQHCAQKFEKIIRSRLWDLDQQKITDQMEDMLRKYNKVTKRKKKTHSYEEDSTEDEEDSSFPFSPVALEMDSSEEYEQPYLQQLQQVIPIGMSPRRIWPAAPYQRMLEMLRQDVQNLPAEPVIGVVPHIGLSAIYRQPVSQHTIDTIKEVGRKYADVATQAGVIWQPKGNWTAPPAADTNSTTSSDPEAKLDSELEKRMSVIENIMNNIKKEIEKTDLPAPDENGLTKKTIKVGSAETTFEWKVPKARPSSP